LETGKTGQELAPQALDLQLSRPGKAENKILQIL
jgi:hypothetical protein